MVSKKRLIDPDALIREHGNDIMNWDKPCAVYISSIKNAPAVDAVEVVHGRWHDVYLMTPWIATGICSHCNLKSYINPDFPFAKYCPNCGAKMDGDWNG